MALEMSFSQDRSDQINHHLGSTDRYQLVFRGSFSEQLKSIDCFEMHFVVCDVEGLASLEIKDVAF